MAGLATPDGDAAFRELAFVTALHRLPARQRAVLVLRDVLGFRAAEVAAMLDVGEAAVTSALQRARAGLAARAGGGERAALPGSPAERTAATRFAEAFELGDVDAVVALLTADAWVTMPPEPLEYQGHAAIAAFLAQAGFAARGAGVTRLVPARANGQPAFGHYRGDPDAAGLAASGLLVLSVTATGAIDVVTRFGADAGLLARFALPATVRDGGIVHSTFIFDRLPFAEARRAAAAD